MLSCPRVGAILQLAATKRQVGPHCIRLKSPYHLLLIMVLICREPGSASQ